MNTKKIALYSKSISRSISEYLRAETNEERLVFLRLLETRSTELSDMVTAEIDAINLPKEEKTMRVHLDCGEYVSELTAMDTVYQDGSRFYCHYCGKGATMDNTKVQFPA